MAKPAPTITARRVLRWAFWPVLVGWWVAHFVGVPVWAEAGGVALLAVCAVPYWQDDVRRVLRRSKNSGSAGR